MLWKPLFVLKENFVNERLREYHARRIVDAGNREIRTREL